MSYKRLSPKIAKALGFEVKAVNREKEAFGNPKYYLNEDKLKELKKIKDNLKPKLSITGKSTLRDGNGKTIIEWTKTNIKEEEKLRVLKEVIKTLKEDITPTIPIDKPKLFKGNKLCNQYTLTDFHFGMMSWAAETGGNWDMKIAEDTLTNFFKISIKQSPDANEAIFAQIGDFLHWDGLDAVTPAHRNILDADTRFAKLVRVVIKVIRRVIKMLLEKYQKVTLIMAEGNHDPASSVWLREMLASFYENESRLIIDTNPDPYYCIVWGENCLFYHHGHKRNVANIDTVFVSKFKKEYGSAKYVYAHLGHKHHDQVRETNLMLVEQHRTLASKDAHASRGGWGSDRDSKVITYHKNYGEVARLTININMLV